MSNQKKQWGAIIVMFALFSMIAFVTNLCAPMAVILKEQFAVGDSLATLGNMGNFIAYAMMGIPSGLLIQKLGYKKTALLAILIGIVGVGIQFLAGYTSPSAAFIVYLVGAFIAGFCMCMLNCVVNPMLNTLGGGGNSGNQLIQFGGVFNSTAAVSVTIIMGGLIGEITKDTKVSQAAPALIGAIVVFIIAFVVLYYSNIPEPKAEQGPKESNMALLKGALSYRHFTLGLVAIFCYMGIEVGVPQYLNLYLTGSVEDGGLGLAAGKAGLIVATYWALMLVGRLCGGLLGSKFSPRAQITTVSAISFVLVLIGMFAPTDTMVDFPVIDFANLGAGVEPTPIPIGVMSLVLVGLCTAVMWGGIFNMAVEGLGKYTAIASGAFMTMVCGGGILIFIQGVVSKATNPLMSYSVVLACAAYVLFYALIGSKPAKK
ncbi:MAG: MFS transporter [Bacteroidaceae bacterium]|nr:MFS transporter [Bacteroidaceae bacterium]